MVGGRNYLDALHFPSLQVRVQSVKQENPYLIPPKIRLADFCGIYSSVFIFFSDRKYESAESAAGKGWHLLKP